MSYYKKHLFVCTNRRDDGTDSCGAVGGDLLLAYAKKACQNMGLAQSGVRVSKAGCLGRCEHGPVMVVYPEASWYTSVDETDVQEIMELDLRDNVRVQRLLIETDEGHVKE